ncbi:hypothetical protein FNV43_RR18838 [Rhamnella rubrinervis]|uniref:Uncharacterized protein n=1 Tax=Rhamnella rubrinervis TaxID=2594499 RepID=A0A8K0E718_9ROSA|nr:hypothetical protein FNV43_RR18838 [Rhamnella rubrinervis]
MPTLGSWPVVSFGGNNEAETNSGATVSAFCASRGCPAFYEHKTPSEIFGNVVKFERKEPVDLVGDRIGNDVREPAFNPSFEVGNAGVVGGAIYEDVVCESTREWVDRIGLRPLMETF